MASRCGVVVVLSLLLGCHSISAPLWPAELHGVQFETSRVPPSATTSADSDSLSASGDSQVPLDIALALAHAGRDEDALSVLATVLRFTVA